MRRSIIDHQWERDFAIDVRDGEMRNTIHGACVYACVSACVNACVCASVRLIRFVSHERKRERHERVVSAYRVYDVGRWARSDLAPSISPSSCTLPERFTY